MKFDEHDLRSYMLLCGSCNRAKSWSCEHCDNWINRKSPEVCAGCYWASPEVYEHVAMQDSRRLDLVRLGSEVAVHDELRRRASAGRQANHVKKVRGWTPRTPSRRNSFRMVAKRLIIWLTLRPAASETANRPFRPELRTTHVPAFLLRFS